MSVEQLSNLLVRWEEEHSAGRDVAEILNKLAELFEVETEAFLKKDPDPFDDRHPSRLQPDCTLGHMLKTIFRNEQIVDAIVRLYCQEENLQLNTAACRLLLDILPGLESVLFEEEGFVPRLLQFAETAPNPLRSYATALVAAAMEVAEIAVNFRDKNAYFVPLMLKRLRELSGKYLRTPGPGEESININRPFAAFKKNSEHLNISEGNRSYEKFNKNDSLKALRHNPIFPEVKSGTVSNSEVKPAPVFDENSNSKWNELMIGSYQVYPLTLVAEQRYILQYLTPMGEYQELIGHVFESNVLSLLLRYIDIRQNPDVRLTFEALKYLASLLVHKKVAVEFLMLGGLKLLLKVPYPSIAATGVSICLYYFSYTEEVMEKICLLSLSDIADLVSYALWLLECSHDSGRCHATMSFEFSFGFKVILGQFDKQDGLRKLFNVMSTLDIFANSEPRSLSDDQVFANRQTTRHVCGALKRYFEAHLAYEIENLSYNNGNTALVNQNKNKAVSLTYKSIEAYINTWHEMLNPMIAWSPVEEFLQFEGVSFILELISDYFSANYSGNYSGRAETVKNALDILKVCSLTSATQLVLCEKINSSNAENLATTGITLLLAAAEGEVLPVADIQKSALQTIINCVCTKIQSGSRRITVSKNVRRIHTAEELLCKLCENIRVNNGILTLINLLSIKTPLTDADAIRALSCKALCGLARSENVKQIISKLPIVTDGHLLDLIREEREDRGPDHAMFCKFGLELITRVTGAPVSAESKSSMLNINKSEIAAKTKVVYNEAQLLQLMCDHLISKGFIETATCLQKEMSAKALSMPSWMQSTYSSLNTPRSGLKRFRTDSFSSAMSPAPHSSSSLCSQSTPLSSIPPPSVPLRIVLTKKTGTPHTPKQSPLSSRLQKPQDCSGDFYQTPAIKKHVNFSQGSQSRISLHSIVTEYLRKQHASCKTPMLTCPPFDLFTQHKCPEPNKRRNAPANCLLRFQKKQIYHRNGGFSGAALDRKCIYNKFRFVRAFRDTDGNCNFAACSFFNYNSDNHPRLLIGTIPQFGSPGSELMVYNINAELEVSKSSHIGGIAHVQSSDVAPLIITSNGSEMGSSLLWRLDENLEIVHEYREVSHLEFSKRGVHKAIGSKQDSAVIIDTATNTEIHKFLTKDAGNNYPLNRATFDYSDELVLTDGMIFDCRSGQLVHKLDKFNAMMNGVFHPNGREIISNTEIWDIYTYKLLRTVSGLEYSKVNFSPSGSIIYGAFWGSYKEIPDERVNCFNTFDAYDYSGIATVDVKRPVFELSPDINDHFIATLESQSTITAQPYPQRGLDCIVRLYEIGRSKEDGDEDNEESEDTDDETEDDDEIHEDELDEDNEGRDDSLFNLLDSDQDTSSDESDALFSLNTSMED